MPWYGQQSLLHPFGTTTSHGVEYVLQSREKASRTVTKIVEELPGMRRETGELIRKAVTENWRAYVLVNHRSEGSAPLTIQVLNDQLRDAPT